MVDKDSGRDLEQMLHRMDDGSSKKTGNYQPPSNLNLEDYERIQMECRYNSDSKPKIRKSNTHRGHQHETCIDEFVCKKKYKTFGILPEVYKYHNSHECQKKKKEDLKKSFQDLGMKYDSKQSDTASQQGLVSSILAGPQSNWYIINHKSKKFRAWRMLIIFLCIFSSFVYAMFAAFIIPKEDE